MVFVSVLMSNLANTGESSYSKQNSSLYFDPNLLIEENDNVSRVKNSGTASGTTTTAYLLTSTFFNSAAQGGGSSTYTSFVDNGMAKFLRLGLDASTNNKSFIQFESSDTSILSLQPENDSFIYYAWINVMVKNTVNETFEIIGTRGIDELGNTIQGATLYGIVTSSEQFQLGFDTETETFRDTNTTYNFGEWYFVAVTRYFSTIKFFTNGVCDPNTQILTHSDSDLYERTTATSETTSYAYVGGTQEGSLYIGHFGMQNYGSSFTGWTNTIVSKYYDETKDYYEHKFEYTMSSNLGLITNTIYLTDLDFRLDIPRMKSNETKIVSKGSFMTDSDDFRVDPLYSANLTTGSSSVSLDNQETLSGLNTLSFAGTADVYNNTSSHYLPFQTVTNEKFNFSSRLSRKQSGDFSFSIWVKPARTSTETTTINGSTKYYNETIFSNMSSHSDGLGYALCIQPNDNKLKLLTASSPIDPYYDYLCHIEVTDDDNIKSNRWVHIVCNFQHSHDDYYYVKIYLNNTLVYEDASNLLDFDMQDDSPFSFGDKADRSRSSIWYLPSGNDDYIVSGTETNQIFGDFEGHIGEFLFFNRLLTVTEIEEIRLSTLYTYYDPLIAQAASNNPTTVTSSPTLLFYLVKVANNIYNDSVLALTDSSTYYNQKDTNIVAGAVYNFSVQDSTNTSKLLRFNSTVDSNDSTFESTYVTRTGTPGSSGATIELDLTSYTGTEVFYFDNDTAGMGYVEAPTSGVTTKVVTVALNTAGTANAYYIDTVEKDVIDALANTTYIFDQSDSTNAGHPIVFGTTSDDTSNFYQPSDGVTIMGTPGQPGAYTKLVLSSTLPGSLYYYCYSHSGMGSAFVDPPTWNFTQTESPPNNLTWYNFGGSCKMSRNGLYCVVSTHERSTSYISYNAVYEYANGSWSLKGSEISETNTQYSYPIDVWISNDGTHIATSYAGSSGSGANSLGYVKIYEYISGSWTLKGSDVSRTGRFGASLSMSDNGNTFACADTTNTPIWVYDYDGSSWVLRGNSSVHQQVTNVTIRGSITCISSDGLRLVAIHRSGGNNIKDAYVVDWNSSTQTWSVVGDNFNTNGIVSHNELSSACYIGENKDFVTTSPRATTLAGLVWKYNSSTNLWEKYGTALGSPPSETSSGIGYSFFPPIINATGTKVGYLDKQYEYNSSTNVWDVKKTFPYNIIGYSDTSVALSNTSSVSNTSSNNTNFKIDFYNFYR